MHSAAFVTVFARNLTHAYKFHIIQKPLDNFFYKLDNLEIICQLIYAASFKNIQNRKGV